MSELVVRSKSIPPMSTESIDRCRALEAALRDMPPVDIDTHHMLHAGVYARTILVPKDTMMTGVLIEIPTVLISCGDAVVYIGDECVEMVGYHVLPASAKRRQAYLTRQDTWLTMIFASDATTVEEAEDQFTSESHLLGSRNEDSKNILTVLGG